MEERPERRYESVRLRKGIGWVDATGRDLVLPPDTETYQGVPDLGRSDGFLLYVVELPQAVAVLSRSSPSWVPEEKAATRLLYSGFEIVVVVWPDGPGAAVATCYSSESDARENAACALWALKAKGGWDESPIMTFRIECATEIPDGRAMPVRSVAWMVVRSSDALRADVSKVRAGGWDVVRAELAAAPGPTPVILIDVDWMMTFNDAYGHQEGDLLIARLWSRMEESAGRVGASLVRVGGEEFVAIAKGATPATALRLAESLRQDVEAMNIPFHHPERSMLGHVTVSAGIVVPDDLSRLPHEAEETVDEAKGGGRNRVVLRGQGPA